MTLIYRRKANPLYLIRYKYGRYRVKKVRIRREKEEGLPLELLSSSSL